LYYVKADGKQNNSLDLKGQGGTLQLVVRSSAARMIRRGDHHRMLDKEVHGRNKGRTQTKM
jgi:hypothetical protein